MRSLATVDGGWVTVARIRSVRIDLDLYAGSDAGPSGALEGRSEFLQALDVVSAAAKARMISGWNIVLGMLYFSSP
jgi:hypothetical protein